MMRGHWRRLILQLLIGVSMLIVNAISSDLYLAVVAVSLVIAPIIVWTVFAVLLWLSRLGPDIQSLNDRVDDMLTAAIASTVAAAIGATILARLFNLIDQPVGSLLTVGIGYVVVAVAIPAITQLRTVRDVWLPMISGKRGSPTDGDAEDSPRGRP